MRNLYRDDKSGRWAVRIVIPQEVREHIRLPRNLEQGRRGLGEFKLSMGTTDEMVAIQKAAPIIAAVKGAIAAAKDARRGIRPLTPETASDALQAWLEAVERGDVDHGLDDVNIRPFLPLANPERYSEETRNALLANARQRAETDAVLKLLPGIYRAAKIEIGDHINSAEQLPFGVGDLGELSLGLSRVRRTAGSKAPTISTTLERWIELARITDQGGIRTYVRRLIEQIGDKPIDKVTQDDMDGMVIALRGFPIVKGGPLTKLPFREVIEKVRTEKLVTLSDKTIRAKWMATYKQLFDFAVSKNLITRSPVTMPSSKREVALERRMFSDGEIKSFFSKPLFTGNDGASEGYLKKPGEIEIRDHRYWLPILALWTGARLDEIGSLSMDEVKSEGEIVFFDLEERKLTGGRRVKNEQSQRRIPVHSSVLAMGFKGYIAERQKAGDAWLFPGLPHDHDTPGGTTHAFGKWFGLYKKAHGLTDRTLVFHSFRHRVKWTLRKDTGIKEELSDVVTGHTNANIGRLYGRGVPIETLSQVVERMSFPTFPL